MKNENLFLKRISNSTLILIIFSLFFLKIFLYILIDNDVIKISLGGGNDANYYNAYAMGYVDSVANVWPVILHFLNGINLYSREFFSYIFLFLNLTIIPIVTTRLSGMSFKDNQKYYLYSFLLCLLYPTLFFYTFDVYRDVFMVFIFLVGCFFVKKSLNNKIFLGFSFFYILAIASGFFLLALRPYLGYAFLIALFLWKVKLTKKRIILLSIIYFLALFFANYLGLLVSLTEYRSGFEEIEAGSTLGLDFSNPMMFIPNFILSLLGQLFGLYIINPLALILFLTETIPFVFMLVYVIKNINLADNFMRFLIIFFVLYASVWLIGNDNLGTAVRLRMYNYFAVYICFFYILRLKTQLRVP